MFNFKTFEGFLISTEFGKLRKKIRQTRQICQLEFRRNSYLPPLRDKVATKPLILLGSEGRKIALKMSPYIFISVVILVFT